MKFTAMVLLTLVCAAPLPASELPGGVVAWGANGNDQTNVPPALTRAVAIAGGLYHSIALEREGTIVAWGDDATGQTNVPASASNSVAIAAGQYHNLALQSNGTVIAWGLNSSGQTNVPVNVTNAVAVAAGALHSLALLADGSVVGWGYNDDGETDVPPSVTNAVAIGAGTFHSMALLADGHVVAWGDNGEGETNVPASATNIVAIASGYMYNLALRDDGRVIAWGDNGQGQTNVPASATNIVMIAAGGYHALALRANDTIVSWGDASQGQRTPPAGLKNIVDLAGGGGHSLAIFLTNAPPVVTGPSNATVFTSFTNDVNTTIEIQLFDNDRDALQVIWRINGGDSITNNIAAGPGSVTSATLSLPVTLHLGTNLVEVIVLDGVTDPVASEFEVALVQLEIRQQLLAALDDLDAIIADVTDAKALSSLNKARTSLSDSTSAAYWEDDSHPDAVTGKNVFKLVGKSASGLAKLLKKPVGGLDTLAVTAVIEQMVIATREAAVLAIEDAEAADGDAKGIAKAQSALATGDLARADGNAKKAISSYGKAWSAAIKATPVVL